MAGAQPNTKLFKDRIRYLMKVMGWTNKDMAKRLGDLSPEYIGMLRSGRSPGPATAALFDRVEAEALGDLEGAVKTSNPRELVRLKRLEKDLSIKEAAKEAGVRPDVWQAIEEGTGQAPEKVMKKMAATLGLDVATLMAGQDETIIRDHVVGTFGALPDIKVIGGGKPKFVPLVSMAQAGTMVETDFTDENYTREGVLAFNVADSKALALRITGDSMADKWGPGSFVIFYPSEKPMPDDPVIARVKPERGGGVLFKFYHPEDGGKRVVLTSYNKQYRPLSYDAEDFLWIKPVRHVITNI